jgi:hypothetical protein
MNNTEETKAISLILKENEINMIIECLDFAVKQTGLKGANYIMLANSIANQANNQLNKPAE